MLIRSRTMSSTRPPACDIFCAVVDNYGDIGVCWRLARQLSIERGWRVRLWVDDLHSFARLCPALDPSASQQLAEGVTISRWIAAPADGAEAQFEAGAAVPEPAGIVIEAFGCDLPPAYIAAMAAKARAPVWINLEYLSAEGWVADLHLRRSPHPRLALTKTFFFPGLTRGTGGMLKEQTLEPDRARFAADPDARPALWRALGVPQPGPRATTVSLFCYENPALDSLLAAWRESPEPISLMVPEGRISPAVGRFFGRTGFSAGARAQAGNLSACALPFTDQPRYDELLWACDVNFVRGEDSFARAQWAQRPFVWHIYPQQDKAHLAKLDAALARYTAALPAAADAALAAFWRAWNTGGSPDWQALWRQRPALDDGARRWARQLAETGNLAATLADFCENQLK
jgi:uncharacterized repeat protein (TIGR03837 family)